MRILMMVLFVLILTACGGSGGSVTPPVSEPTTVECTIIATPSGGAVYQVYVGLYTEWGQPPVDGSFTDDYGRVILYPPPGTYDVVLTFSTTSGRSIVLERGLVVIKGAQIVRRYEVAE